MPIALETLHAAGWRGVDELASSVPRAQDSHKIGPPPTNCYEYRGWLVNIELAALGDSATATAGLSCGGASRCRITLSIRKEGVARLRASVEGKVNAYIDEALWAPSDANHGFHQGASDPDGRSPTAVQNEQGVL